MWLDCLCAFSKHFCLELAACISGTPFWLSICLVFSNIFVWRVCLFLINHVRPEAQNLSCCLCVFVSEEWSSLDCQIYKLYTYTEVQRTLIQTTTKREEGAPSKAATCECIPSSLNSCWTWSPVQKSRIGQQQKVQKGRQRQHHWQ